jgi:1,4-alpha-glucan branching enzyme
MIKFNPKTKKTAFEIHLPNAQHVSLLGDFNGWNEETHPLKKDKSGRWKAEIKLEPGEYQFLYRVDHSHWQADDHAPTKPNNFGTENSVVVLSREEKTAAPKPAKTVKRASKKK